MATAGEYGIITALICAGVAVIIIGNPLSDKPKWDDNTDKKTAAAACTARPAGDTKNVVIKDWLQHNAEYKCSDWPKFTWPTYVGPYYIDGSRK